MHLEISRQKKVGELIDRSPTATPFETRSGSPARGNRMPHTLQEAEVAVERLHAFLSGEVISPAAAMELAIPDQQSASIKPKEVYMMETVGAADGSISVSVITKIKLLMVYFAINLGLTLFNKAIMIKVRVHPSPTYRVICTLNPRIYSLLRSYVKAEVALCDCLSVQVDPGILEDLH